MILRYFFKSRSWRDFYRPRTKIGISHTPKLMYSQNKHGVLETVKTAKNLFCLLRGRIRIIQNNLENVAKLGVCDIDKKIDIYLDIFCDFIDNNN